MWSHPRFHSIWILILLLPPPGNAGALDDLPHGAQRPDPVWPAPRAAKESPTGAIVGIIEQHGTGKPVDYANVILLGTPVGTLSLYGGRFALVGLPAGDHTVRASFVGFEPRTLARARVLPHSTTVVRLCLQENPGLAMVLEVVPQKASGPTPEPRDRVSPSSGVRFQQEQIERVLRSCPCDGVRAIAGTYKGMRDSAAPRGEIEALPATANRLVGNVPNPFNAATRVRFELAAGAPVALEVFDVRGRIVRTLLVGELEAGRHAVVWNGKTDAGTDVSSGIYFLRMATAGFVSSHKLILLR